ncbi:hypothetical protein D3C86_1068070 [compost metagenome]
MVEALDQSCARKRLSDDLGRWLTAQLFRRYAVRIGHIDDGLSLPRWQRLCDIQVGLKTHSKKDDVRADSVGQRFWNDRRPDSSRIGCKVFRTASGCHGYVDAFAGKRLCQGMADFAEADNCVAHIISFRIYRARRMMERRSGAAD